MFEASRLRWALGGALLVVLVNCSLVGAQLGIDTQNASGDTCECSPACEGDAGECRSRVVAREDCPCCKVCTRREGELCAPPAIPCDTQFGYICSPEGVCKAEFSCQSDKECPSHRFCLGGVCADPCPILTPCQGSLEGGVCVAEEHRSECKCPEGTLENSAGNVCVPNNETTKGCQYDGRLYAEGEKRYAGECQEQCLCGTDGQFTCSPVSCPAGLFLAGQHSKEELCIELRNRPEADECCVVVACANSLTRPSLLWSPADLPLKPITEEEALSDGQNVRALSGRNVGPDRLEPISDTEYQRRLKDLEDELNKGHGGGKPTGTTTSTEYETNTTTTEHETNTNTQHETNTNTQHEMNATDNAQGAAGTDNQESVPEGALAVTEMAMADGTIQQEEEEEEGMEEVTTMMPEMQKDEEMMPKEGKPAVVVEYNADGKEVQRVTVQVQEQVEVVTMPSEDLDITTSATGFDDMTTDATTEEQEMATEAAPVEVVEEEFMARNESTREGKMAPEDASTANESAITLQEKAETLSKASAGGLKVLAVTHNSSTLVLPSTKGGDIFYKAVDSSDWQRVSVEGGQDSLVLKTLQPSTQYTLKWSGAASGSAKITIDTLEGCKVENISYGVSQEWSDGCQHRCSCRPGGNSDCQPRCLFVAGDIKDPLCTERPSVEDPDCCVAYDCKKTDDSLVPTILEEEQKPGQPKLLVTEITHNSVTLAWDDFRTRTYEGGYVIEYRERDESSTPAPVEESWMRKELPTGPHQPKLTVDNLKPNTVYQVRVSIYDESDDTRLGESTETLTVRTEPGCMYRNESYIVGEFFNGCEERCMCLANGETKCYERCTLPYFRAGSFQNDPLCREQPTDNDECCVIVQCATGDANIRQGVNATTFTDIAYNQCSNVVCGDNAKCVTSSMASDNMNLNDNSNVTPGSCRCLEGFIGDPTDLQYGCIRDPNAERKEGGCTFKNSTYRSGDVFYDNCDYRCSCNNNTEIECEPRCEFPHEDGSKTEPGCEYLQDPKDSCCKLRVCNSTSEAATDAARAPSLISNGCTEGNVTYAKNETFYKGCQTQCICMGFGDVSCFPRCPPPKVVSGNPKHCQTLPDPQDSCCSITVCDEVTPDVMKANITEMEKEMMMMKERMKNMTETEKEMLMKRTSELEKEMMKNISDMQMILQKMIEEKNKLMNSNITEMEKEMIKKNMTEIEMMMQDVADMEREITSSNMTDMEKEILKRKLMEMQKKLTDEMLSEMDEHTRLHLLGIEHSHAHDMGDMQNHTHTHDDGTTHTHPGGHLPHSHDDMNDTDTFHIHAHTHEDGTTHSHSHDHMDESHNHTHGMNEGQGHIHTHEDGTTHSHPHNHMDESHSHTHDMDNMQNRTHTHDDGTTHTHLVGHIPHSHDDKSTMQDRTHTHDDGTTHTHPGGHLPHDHDMNEMQNHTHTHDDGTTHTHPGGHLPHDHDMNDMQNHTHTHDDGTTHTHPGGHLPHDHDMNDMQNLTHIHDDGTTHTHADGHLPHSLDDMSGMQNHTHTHDDGTTHTHPSGHIPHDHEDMDDMKNHTHTHDDGTTHTHPGGHLPHSHDNVNDTDTFHILAHTHEDGTTHSHPHDHVDESHNHTHDMNEEHGHMHTLEDGTTHSHPHDHMDESHNHTHDMNEEPGHMHTHEDGTTHSHPHDHIDESHNHTHNMNEEHGHVHTHEDGTTHSHPHDHMDESHNHTHDMDEKHSHVHMHEDGTLHSHTHDHVNDTHDHENDMSEGANLTHTHEDGTTHTHPVLDEFHNHTTFNNLEKKNRAEDLGTHDLNILSVMPVDMTTVKMTVAVSKSVMNQLLSSEEEYVKVRYSTDSLSWMERNISIADIDVEHMEEIVLYINDLQPSTPYQFQISYRDYLSSTSKARLLDGITDSDVTDAGFDIDSSAMCSHNGRHYKPGEEFYEGCSHTCMCSSSLEVHCVAIECPVTFGLDIIDPYCLEWDLDKDVVPTPPKCCPQVKCTKSAACHYQGQVFNNYDTIPRELTGCSKSCSCEYGNVTCRDLCDPVPLYPPPDLNCPSEDAVRITLPGETCCETWQCPGHSVGDFEFLGTTDLVETTSYPGGSEGTSVVFPLPPESVLTGTHTSGFIPIDPSVTPHFGEGIPRPHITQQDAYSAHLMFSTPIHYQGLPGELLVRYTKDPASQPDPERWTREIIVPAGNTLSRSKWEYTVPDLEPATQYTMQVMLTITNADPVTSPVFTFTTMQEASTPPTTTPLARLDIDAELYASEITKTSAKVSWRIFDDYELQYIDGVQVRYIEKDKKMYRFSQLFHRTNNQMDLRDLHPNNTYTVDLVFITDKNQSTTVTNTQPITFETLPEEDPYAFDIEITAGKVSSQTAELYYSGVPEPAEKYVNVYRAVYHKAKERIDAQTFKIPKSGQEKKVFLSELKPDVEYQVWLEAYLSNGRKKKSNVVTITTRAGQLPTPERSEVDRSVSDVKQGDSYYPALVAVAIIAAIACIGFLGLLIVLLRKQNHAKAHINSSRNNAAYDNPSYKVGDNGYDMEMNGIKGSGNGATHMEDP